MKSLLLVAFAAVLCAQPPANGGPQGPPPQGFPPQGPGPGGGGPGFGGGRGPMGPPGLRGLPGKWWQDPNIRQRLSLTDEQSKKMEEVFRAHRLRLIDLNANLQREEANLDPLLEADQIDEAKAVAQSDRVVLARAELEKANSRFLIGIRRILSPEQWRKMEAERRPMPRFPGPPPGARPQE